MTQNGSICAEEYVVKRGDSFYLIAHKLGVPLRDLLAANRDIHPARLMVGDVLCIPREEDDRPQGGNAGSGNAGSSAGNSSGSGTGNGGTANGNTGSGSSSTGSSNTTGGNSTSGNTGNAGSGNAGSATPGTSQQGSGAISSGNTGTSSTSSPENTGNASSSNSNSSGSGNTSGGNTSTDGTATNGSPIATPPPTVPGLACPIEEQVTIAQGQTIADIQLQNLLSRNTLQTANPALDLDTLEAGQTICVPTENIACRLPSTYTLAAGETLEAVAMRFNLPLGSLLRVNPCLAPQDFEEGVTVILPR
ncbi:MAG: LysM peptidoglycan-binding domain-containing protein [Clostridia bacterium]|nr:LysM peptidoglycan-binding domain-containing protein [Clostridia bacterium]